MRIALSRSAPPPTPRASHAARIVLASAIYDLVVTLPFATPWTARPLFALLAAAHAHLGLPGNPPALIGPEPLLFANLMGSLVVVWSLVRLRSPEPWLGAADTLGRALFSAWMLVALAGGASRVLAPFLLFELAWGVAQGLAVLPVLRAAPARTMDA